MKEGATYAPSFFDHLNNNSKEPSLLYIEGLLVRENLEFCGDCPHVGETFLFKTLNKEEDKASLLISHVDLTPF